jgi:hypothetical protein
MPTLKHFRRRYEYLALALPVIGIGNRECFDSLIESISNSRALAAM